MVKGEECFAIFVLKFSVVRNGGGKMESYGYKKRREHQVLPSFIINESVFHLNSFYFTLGPAPHCGAP